MLCAMNQTGYGKWWTVAALLVLFGCGRELPSPAAVENDVAAEPVTQLPVSDEEKTSYMLGANFARGIPPEVLQLNPEFVLRGITDVLEERASLLSVEDQHRMMNKLSVAMREHQQHRHTLMNQQHAAHLESVRTAGEKMLQENQAKDGVTVLPSGVQYQVMHSGNGNGKHPNAKDRLRIHYSAGFMTEAGVQEVANTFESAPAIITVGEVIEGWQEVLPLMQEGDQWQIAVPAAKAKGYPGTNGGEIPDTATLLYQVQLLEVLK